MKRNTRTTLSVLSSFLVFLLFFSVNTSAQSTSDSVSVFLTAADARLREGNSEASLVYIRKIFDSGKPVPPEAYLIYGIIQLDQGDFVRARETFRKLQEHSLADSSLKMEARALFDTASAYICPGCNNTGVRHVEKDCISCRGTGKKDRVCSYCKGATPVCLSCNGKGVVKDAMSFGGRFVKCSKCKGSGIGTCPRCEGSHVEYYFCTVCQGKGKISTTESCSH
jgi:hypothetical protein